VPPNPSAGSNAVSEEAKRFALKLAGGAKSGGVRTQAMDEHDIRGNTGAAYHRDEASELICSCHTFRHEALDGCGVKVDWKVLVSLRYSTKLLDGVRFGELVIWKGKPTGDGVRVRGQW
jgi:hypothetical protein